MRKLEVNLVALGVKEIKISQTKSKVTTTGITCAGIGKKAGM